MAPSPHSGFRVRADWFALVLVGAVVSAPFVGWPLTGDLPLRPNDALGDVRDMSLAYLAFIERSHGDGYFPLWTRALYSGFPFAAFPHTTAFAVTAWLPGAAATVMTAAWWVCTLVFSAGIYVCSRDLGASRTASALMAVATNYAGLFYGLGGNLFFLHTVCITPWVFLHVRRIFEAAAIQRTSFLSLAALTTLQLLGGELEVFAYQGVAIGLLWVMGRSAFGRRRGAAIAIAGAFVTGALIAFPLLTTFSELIAHSIRAGGVAPELARTAWLGAPSEILAAGLLTPVRLSAVSPLMTGAAPVLYWGMLPLIGLAAAKRTGTQRAWAWAGIVVFLLALRPSFLGSIIAHIPVLGTGLLPYKGAVIAQILLAAAAAPGIDSLRHHNGDAAEARRPRTRPIVLLAAVFLLAGFYAFVSSKAPVLTTALYLPWRWAPAGCAAGLVILILVRRSAQTPITVALFVLVALDVVIPQLRDLSLSSPEVFQYSPTHATHDENGRQHRFNLDVIGLTQPFAWQGGLYTDGREDIDGKVRLPLHRYAELLSTMAPGYVQFDAQGRLARFRDPLPRHPDVIKNHLHLFDLLGVRTVYKDTPGMTYGGPLSLATVLPSATVSTASDATYPELAPDGGLVLTSPTGVAWTAGMRPGEELTGLSFDAQSEAGSTLVAARLHCQGRMPRLLYARIVRGTQSIAVPPLDVGRDHIACVVGVGVVPTPPAPDIDMPARVHFEAPRLANESVPLQGIPGTADPWAYTNTGALPLAHIVHQSIVMPDRLQRLGFMARGDLFAPDRMVVLDRYIPLPPSLSTPRASTTAHITAREDQFIRYAATLSQPGFLVMSEPYYPGWRAWVNGREARIVHANHALRALALPEGTHDIVLRYLPISFRIGLWVSLASLAGWGVFLVQHMREHRWPDDG